MDELANTLNQISFWIITLCLLTVVIILTVYSIIIRETELVRTRPGLFVVELLCFSIIPSIPVFIFGYVRNLPLKLTFYLFISFVLKLAILHLLLEFSGFYKWLFYNKV